MNWKKQIQESIIDVDDLCKSIELDEDAERYCAEVVKKYPMRITPFYLSLVENENDPIYRMCVPTKYELSSSGALDTSGEQSNTKQEGLQHKYKQTALVLTTNACAMYCRYCFRKRLVGISEEELAKQVDDVANYVREHPEITNVLLTGGDALINSNDLIAKYLKELCEIETLDFIRFGSRVPVVLPQRIYEDTELLNILEYYGKKKSVYLVTQFNHPKEITQEAVRSVKALQKIGIQVRNQTVLLKDVNDDAEILGSLLRKLAEIEVVPYYIFQCRPVTGVKERFQVPLLDGVKIVDAAKSTQSGISKCVRYVMSHPRGKIEIIGTLGKNEMLLKFHQNKSPEDESRIFTVNLSDEDTWLDNNLRGIK